MNNQCVVGVFDSLPLAKSAVHILDRAGLAPDNVSLVTRHVEPASETGQQLNLGDDSLHDGLIGATLGGLAGVIGEAALLLITGVGAVIVAGPLMVTAGAIVGAFLGAMEGWGVHQRQIKEYEQLVRDGSVLVVVNGNPQQVAEAARMLRETVADEVHLYAESSDDAPEIDDRPTHSPPQNPSTSTETLP